MDPKLDNVTTLISYHVDEFPCSVRPLSSSFPSFKEITLMIGCKLSHFLNKYVIPRMNGRTDSKFEQPFERLHNR